MKKIHGIFIVIVLIVLGVAAFLAVQRFFTVREDTTAVVKEMRALNRWETSSFTIEKIIDAGTGGNAFQQFLFGNRILLIAHGEVIGGFDVSHVSEKDIDIHNSRIAITLPAPQILDARIDNTQTRVYDREQGLLVSPNNNLESDALATAQKSIQDAACSEGILTITAANAKSQLTSLFTSLHFSDITITIPPGHC